jgi:hypothetical protein
MMAICGLGGLVWGLIWRDRLRLRTFFGAVTGLLVYFLFYGVIWKRFNPLIPLYAPELQLEIGYILWGLALARSPLYSRRIQAAQMRG